MKQRVKLKTIMASAGMVCAVGFAVIVSGTVYHWPPSWPKELEPLCRQSTYNELATSIHETVYEIPFYTREQFEWAWPFIVGLKSKGAPIILEGSPSTYVGRPLAPGVRVLWPPSHTPITNSVKLGSGESPEYVVYMDGVPVPYTGQQHRFRFRARVDIVLVTDGLIVSTNGIKIPPQTPIIDNRVSK